LPQSLRQRREPVRIELRANREGRLDPLWQALGAGDAQEMRSIDVKDIEGQRYVGQPLCLGHELLG
jgi:hypothetical protein